METTQITNTEEYYYMIYLLGGILYSPQKLQITLTHVSINR